MVDSLSLTMTPQCEGRHRFYFLQICRSEIVLFLSLGGMHRTSCEGKGAGVDSSRSQHNVTTRGPGKDKIFSMMLDHAEVLTDRNNRHKICLSHKSPGAWSKPSA